MPRVILHVDMDAFFASVECALNPALRGKPLIVGGNPDERGVVSCPSYEARARGVRTAMPLVEAGRLCPEGVFVRPNFAAYAEYSRQTREIMRTYTPLLEPMSMDEAYLDVTGSRELFGDGEAIAREIKRRVWEQLNITCSVGVAGNKCCAKVASDFHKPDGLTVVPEGGEAEFLAPLPLKDLPGLGRQTAARLRSWNVTTIGQFAALPDDLVRAHFGQGGMGLLALARGRDESPVQAPRAAKSISREHTFGRDTADLEAIRRTMQALCDDCCTRLRRDGRVAATVGVKVRNSRFETLERSRTLPQASDVEEEIWPVAWGLARPVLQGALPVRLVGVGLANLREGAEQLSLDADLRQRRRRLHGTVDRIRERMGERTVLRGSELPPAR